MKKEELVVYIEEKGFVNISENEWAKKYKIKDEEMRNVQGKKKIREVFLTVIYEFKTAGLDTSVAVYYVADDDTKVKRYKGKLSKLKFGGFGEIAGMTLLK